MAHEIGATLTLRDNMSATLRGVRNEQSAFRQDVQATQRTLRQQMNVRLDATAATRTISRIRTAIEPLRSRIVTQVAIQDNATRERRRIQNELNALGRRAVAPLVSVRDSASRVIGNIGSKLALLRAAAAVPIVVGAAAAAGGVAALKSGAQLEQQEIAMKHFIGVNNQGKSDAEITKMRDSYIKDLRKNADATPFSTSEVIGAGARAVNVMGGDTKGAMDLVKLAGDMAALNPGKTISDSMEALADAKNGEFERMKEFGFKISAEEFKGYVGKGKNDDLSSAETTTAYQMLVNKKLNPYFKGGSEKLSQSGTGLMSTITGNLGSKVQDTGRQMLERLKPTLVSVIGLIDKYGPQMDKFGLKIADGIGFAVSKLPTLKKFLSESFEVARPVISWVADTGFPKVRDILGDVLDKATGVYNFFKDNWGTIGPLVTGVAIAFGAYKAVMMAMEMVTIAVTAAQLALNLAMNLNPMGLLVVGVGLLIGAGILLYKNWDTVKTKAEEVWVTIENAFKTGVNGAIDLINGLITQIRKIPGVDIPLIAHVQMSKTTAQQVSDAKTAGYTDNWAVNGKHANGLDYVPFDGYTAELHKGESVLPKKEAEQWRNLTSHGIGFYRDGISNIGYNQVAQLHTGEAVLSKNQMTQWIELTRKSPTVAPVTSVSPMAPLKINKPASVTPANTSIKTAALAGERSIPKVNPEWWARAVNGLTSQQADSLTETLGAMGHSKKFAFDAIQKAYRRNISKVDLINFSSLGAYIEEVQAIRGIGHNSKHMAQSLSKFQGINKVLGPIGAALNVLNILTADDKLEAIVGTVGGVLGGAAGGAIAGAGVGALAGMGILSAPLALVGGIVGSVGGAIAGQYAAGKLYELVKESHQVNGSHSNGLNYVPFDGYIAKLHKGERVQRASENPYNGGSGSSNSDSGRVTIMIPKLADTINASNPADVDEMLFKLEDKLLLVAANMPGG